MVVNIVTDSTADLPEGLLEQYRIRSVPLKVHFGDEEFHDGVDITAGQFYDRLKASETLPTTSQPSPGEFAAAYREIWEEKGGSIVSIHLSSQLSGTYRSAVMAQSTLPDADIEVIDSQVASLVQGLIVLAAARAANEGKGKDEVVALVKELMEKVKVFFMVDTLEYLKKGGRIGKAQAFLGTVLNIKPILTLEDGLVVPVAKARGRSKGIDQLLGRMEEEIGTGKQKQMGILHAANGEGAAQLKERIVERWDVEDLVISEVGPVVGTHVGPGTLAIIGFKP